MAIVLVTWVETPEIRLRTGWEETPSTSYRNLGFTLIKLGNHCRALIRHGPILVIIRLLWMQCGALKRGSKAIREASAMVQVRSDGGMVGSNSNRNRKYG